MVLLVEHVGRHHEVERGEIVRQPPPVEEQRLEAGGPVAVGVVANALERVLLVVARHRPEAPPLRHDGGQREAAAEFEEAATSPLERRHVFGQHEGRLPDVCPVGDPLVPLERLHVDQRVEVGRQPEGERLAADVDRPLHRRKSLVARLVTHPHRPPPSHPSPPTAYLPSFASPAAARSPAACHDCTVPPPTASRAPHALRLRPAPVRRRTALEEL